MADVAICKRCGRELPLDCFYKRNNGSPSSWCKECSKESSNQRYHKLREAADNTPPQQSAKVGRSKLKKVYTDPELAKFTERQLMAELSARGFHAKGTVTREFSF